VIKKELIIEASNEITRVLEAIDRGEPQAAAELLPLVYDELRKLAAHRVANERADHTLQATALVHEAYLRLVGDNQGKRWDGRGHFFAAAAESMRRILVEAARRRDRLKRGGDLRRVELVDQAEPDSDSKLLALDEALIRLAKEDPIAAKVVELKRFGGIGHEETAAALRITVYLARQKWTYARAWLRDAMGEE
jgi:RNA polymerase sigma factor (TIGR02999 family)